MKKIKFTICITLFSVAIIYSQTTITNNPSTRYQAMKGWGVSVAWWGNLVGGMPQASIDDICNRVAVEANLNFFRFNIGGGDNPNCPSGKHMRFDADMPGYRPFYANNQGFGVVDVSKDYRQIAVMDKLASLRAPYGDIITEMFSCSPPYYMTNSFCSSGAVSALNENLAPGFEDDFADYLCSVTKTLRDTHSNWNIQDIEPFNEPYSNFWPAYGGQEGCKMLADQQATVLYNVWLKQQEYGIGNLSLVASDCNSITEGLQNAYDLWANHRNEYNGLSAFAVHSYFGTSQEKADLYTNVTINTGKPIWQAETGPLEWYLPTGGQWWWRHYDIAQRLIDDIRNLKSEVWCSWQAHGGDDGWALVQQTNFDQNNPYQTPVFRNTRSFYIYKQIASYVKVGYTQIANSDPNSMTFVSPDNKKIVVVVTNNSTTAKDYSIDLSNFQPITYFDTYRTSGGDDNGENAKLLTSPTTLQKGVLSANRIAYSAPAWSVTTFVASVDTPVSVSLNDFESVTPNTVVRYGSDLSIVNNPLVNAPNATTKTARLARTTTNWYELFAFDIAPIAVPANTTYYLHALVKYDSAADIAIRCDGDNRDTDGITTIRASNPYTSLDAGQWKDLVFAIAGGTSGVTVNAIQIFPDLGFLNNPALQVLNNSTSFGYIDELLVSTSSTERTTVAAPTLASTLANFDGISPVATTAYGATQTLVANPYPNGGNTSANVIRIGRTSTDWYEYTKFNIPDFALSAGETKYIHIAVNYPALPVASIRIDVDNTSAPAGQVDILPVNTYASASNGHWQDLVFAVSGGAKGLAVNNLVLVADVGNYAAPPAGQVLDNTTNYAYIDNIILNNSATPLFTARTSLQAITLFATLNTNPTPRLVDYTNAGVTGVTSTNLTAVNAAVDIANPAPTTLVAVQAIVNQTLALAVITSYASSNTNPVPTVLNYTNAGVTGVTSTNLTVVNVAIDRANPAPTSLSQVQAVVNQVLVALNFVPVSLNDFETVAPNTVVRYGSDLSIVNNPLINGTNATAKTARLARTTTNWYELFAFDIAPIAVPANTTYYLHALVKYDSATDIAIRYDATNRDTDGVTPIRASNPYTSLDAGQWKDLVFAIAGGPSGVTVNAIQFHPDLGFENTPAVQVLNNSTSFGYIDELLLDGTSIARTTVAAPTLASTLANFDGISPAATTAYGATQSVVSNPYPNGGNTSANVIRIGRTSTDWYEHTKFNIPDFALSAGETKYIHIAVNYPALPVASIRIDVDNTSLPDGAIDVLPVNTYASASNGHWQDLVFAVSGGAKGLAVNNLVLVADIGNYAAPPAGQVLDNTTNYAYIDNIILNSSATPLFTARTSLQAITLYATSNTNPTPRLVDYTNAGVTGVTANNLTSVNTTIDAASPAPSTLAEIQAVVDSLFNFVWIGTTSTNWSVESNWDKGVLPDSNSVVTIPSEVPFQPILTTNSTIKTLEIQNGSSLIVASDANLTVKGAITNNGTMTLATNANLIQEGTINSNTGIIKVTRNSNALSRLDYTIWSSPVAGQNLLSFSPITITSRFYSYKESTNFYNVIADPSSVSFEQATGYLIRMPNNGVTAPLNQTFTGVFTGIPNNGDIIKAITYSGSELFGYNIVGNPYPSTIDADTFLAVNSENIENSLYFWRKINDASGSAYAVYNPLGGTSATPSSDLPNGIIQVGQGFLVKAKKNTNLIFSNTMRVANNANQFFRMKQFEKDRIWLNLTNASGIFSQTLIGYVADAILGVDRYDTKYINDSATSLTSSINDKEYTIQGRPTFDILDIVPLNFKADSSGEYTIAIDHVDGLFAKGQDIYLVDSKTGIETDLKIGGYTFTAAAGVDNTRFNLKYQKALKVDAPTLNENNVKVYRKNGILYVNSSNVAIRNIKIFDMQGKLILEQKDVNSTKSLIKDLKETDQVLMVCITGEDHNVVTKKVLN